MSIFNSFKEKDEERKRKEQERKEQATREKYRTYAVGTGSLGATGSFENKMLDRKIKKASENYDINKQYSTLDKKIKGEIVTPEVKDAQNRLSTLNDQTKGLVHAYGEKYYDLKPAERGQSFEQYQAQKLADKIGKVSGLNGDALSQALSDAKLVTAYKNGGFNNLNSDEKLTYSKGSLNKKSDEERKDLLDYAAANYNFKSIVGGEAFSSDGSVAENLLLPDYTDQFKDGLSLKKKRKALKEKYGYSDEELDLNLDFAQRVYNESMQNQRNETVAIDPNASSFEKFKGAAKNTAYDLANTIPRGFTALGSRLEADNNPMGYDPNSPFNVMMNTTNEAKNQVTENAITQVHPVGQFLYNAGVSAAESGVNVLAGGAIFGSAGQYATLMPFAADAYSSTYQSAKERGLSDEDADTLALSSALIETGTELVSLDHLYDIAKSSGKAFTKKVVYDWLAQGGIEASEEFASEILNNIVDNTVAGSESEYQNNIKNYIAQGLSEEEARSQANKDFWKQVGESALAGGISGLMMGGVAVGTNTISTKSNLKSSAEQYGKYAKSIEGTTNEQKAYKEQYEKYEQNPVRAIADRIDDSTEEGKQQKAEVMAVAQKESEGKKLNAQDIYTINRVTENATSTEQKYMEHVMSVANVPEEYRTAMTGITVEEARSKMQDAAKSGDAEAMGEVYHIMQNAMSKEVQDAADDTFLDFIGLAENNGANEDALMDAATSTMEAYKKGLEGQSKESLGTVNSKVEAAFNEGVQAKLISESITLEDSALKYENPEFIKQYIENYTNDLNVAQYDQAVNTFATAGKARLDFDNLVNGRYGWLVEKIGEDRARQFYDMGLNQANNEAKAKANAGIIRTLNHRKVGSFTDMRSDKSSGKYDQVLSFVANVTGLNIRLWDDGMIRGANGKIQADARADYRASAGEINLTTSNISSVFHELTHFGQDFAAEEYKKFKSTVLEALSNHLGETDFTQMMRNFSATYEGSTQDEITDELVASAMVGIMTDQEAWREFGKVLTKNYTVQEATNIKEKIIEFFNNVLDGFRKLIDESHMSKAERAVYNAKIDNQMDIVKQYSKMLDKAIKEHKSTIDEEIAKVDSDAKNSLASIMDAFGFNLEIRNHQAVAIDSNGNEIKHFTESMVTNSQVGAILNLGIAAGNITEEDKAKQITFFTDLMNQAITMQDVDLVWAINSLIGYRVVNDGHYEVDKNSKFAAITGNSDPQYSSTFDPSTICIKTQAVVDVMSEVMKREKRGLTREEIVDFVYKETHKAGEPVPCPVCYVFSRWVGLGGLLDTIKNLQEHFPVSMSNEEILKIKSKLEKDIAKMTKELGSASKSESKIRKDFETLALKKWTAESNDKVKFTDKDQQKYDLYQKYIDMLDQNTWFEKVRLNQDYATKGLVPDDVLFDVNKGREFAENYPLTWLFRTTKGSGMGKATLPYSDMKLGQFIRAIGSPSSIGKNLGQLGRNPFLYFKGEKVTGGEANKSAKALFNNATKKIKAQNLLNGQRMQSTSDYKFEYGLDYLLAFFELQAVGAKVQLYTKVPEAVPMFATVNAEVNLSLMPKGMGYEIDDNGNIHLTFSSITGMNAADAEMLSKQFDNVQPILVGINDEHIKAALQTGWITFIIPYHASGSTEDRYKAMMEIVGEAVPTRSDYTNYQSDLEMSLEYVMENLTDGDEKKARAMIKQFETARSLRKAILTNEKRFDKNGKLVKGDLTDLQKKELKKFPKLKELYNRFYVEGVDSSTYGVNLTAKPAEMIMPYEYWDKSLNKAQADRNTENFKAYCDMLGMIPRFSGFKKGDVERSGYDFSTIPGYWKMLIDRSMYNNDGTYHEQKSINISNFEMGFFDRKQTVEKLQLKNPSVPNDPSKVGMIADRVQQDINDARKSLDTDSEGNKLTENQVNFFKNSKVRDEDGNLRVVYHGTSENFTVFDRTKTRANMDIQGMFFSPYDIDAEGYGNTKAYYLNLTNPADESTSIKALMKFKGQNGAGIKARELLVSQGYDGVYNGYDEYIAFEPNQIKLIDNLNPTENDDIRYSKETDKIKIEDMERVDSQLAYNAGTRNEIVISNDVEMLNAIKNSLNNPKTKMTYHFANVTDDALERLKSDIGSRYFKNGSYSISISSDAIRHLSDHFDSETKILDAISKIYKTVIDYDLVLRDEDSEQTLFIMGKEFSDHDYLAAEIASKSKRSLEIKTFYAINDNKNKKSKIHSLANSYKGELASQTVLLFKDIVSNKSKKVNNINSIYEKALANNDMSEAQLMVDWAAILNGYTAKAYHGSRQIFNEFDESKLGSNTHTESSKRWFFAADKETANSYYPYGVMKELEKQNPKMFNADALKPELRGKLYNLYIRMDNPLVVDVSNYDYESHKEKQDAFVEFIDQAEKNGNDAIVLLNAMDNQLKTGARESIVYMFKKPNQVKSADIVTYDDNGKIISLDERFNDNSNDIRYSKDTDWLSALSLDDLFIEDIISEIEEVEPSNDTYDVEDYADALREMLEADTKLKKVKAQKHLTRATIGKEFKAKGKSVAFTDERLEKYIDYHTEGEGQSSAYVTYMSPADFLLLAANSSNSDERFQNIKRGSHPLNEEELKNSGKIYLSIKKNSDGTGRVVGHEGRHRMFALGVSGFERVPVVVYEEDYKTYKNRKHLDSLTLMPQKFDDGVVYHRSNAVTLNDLDVLYKDNKDYLIQKYGSGAEADVRYSKEMKPLDLAARVYDFASDFDYYQTYDAVGEEGMNEIDAIAESISKGEVGYFIDTIEDILYDDDLDMLPETRTNGEQILNALKSFGGTRYSLVERDDYITEDYEAPVEESILKEGLKALKNHPVNKSAVKKIAIDLINENHSTMPVSKLTNDISKAFAYLSTQEHMTYKDAARIMEEIAKPMLEASNDIEGDEEYNNFISAVGKVRLTDNQMKEVKKMFGSYGEFKAMVSPLQINMNATVSLDDVWESIVDNSYGNLDYDTTENDQAFALYDAIRSLRPSIVNKFGGDLDEVSKEVGIRIIEEYLRNEGKEDTAKILKQGREEYRNKIKSQYDARLKRAREELAVDRRWQKNLAKRDYEERLKQDKEALKQKNAEYRQKLNEKFDEKAKRVKLEADVDRMWQKNLAHQDYLDRVAELRARNKQLSQQKAETIRANKVKKSIEQNVVKLQKWIANPSEEHHVPMDMVEPILEFMTALDFVEPEIKTDGKTFYVNIFDHMEYHNGKKSPQYIRIEGKTKAEVRDKFYDLLNQGKGSKNQRTWVDRMRSIKDLYAKAVSGNNFENSDVTDFIAQLDGSLVDELDNLIANDRGIIYVNDFDSKQLTVVDKVIKNIIQVVNRGNKAAAQNADIKLLSEDTISRSKGKVMSDSSVRKWFVLDMATPLSYFDNMGDGASKIYRGLRSGFNTKIRDIKTASEFMENLISPKKAKDWTGNNPDYKTFNIGDRKIDLTVAQIMSLYELVKRDQTLGHLKGGFTPTTFKTGKFNKVTHNLDERPVHLTNEEIIRITDTLTDEQKRVADEMQHFLADTCSEWGNEVSRNLYGYEKFLDPNYFPITSDKNYLMSNNENTAFDSLNGIERSGFTKQVIKNASNPIVIADIFDVFTKHVNDMATYHGFAAPIKDANRWFNYKTVESLDEDVSDYSSVKDAISRLSGQGGQQYYIKLIKDLNGMEKSQYIAPFIEKVMSGYKSAAVGGNIRVVIQQPTAYFRAANIIDPKYLASGLVSPREAKRIGKMMREQSEIAWWKSQGYFETSIGKSMKNIITGQESAAERIKEFAMAPAGIADDITWGVLYTAVAKEQSALGLKGDELEKAIKERFDEVVDQTQVVDSTLHRSQLMRSKDKLNVIQTAFMAEPIKSYNMLMRAAMTKDKSKISRAALTFVVTNVITAAAASLIDAFRRDDDDKDWGEEYVKAFKEGVIDNVNPLNLIPILKDFMNAFMNLGSYQVQSNRMDLDAVNSLISTGKTWIDFISGDSNKTWYGMLMTTIKPASQLTGIPAYNIMRDASALYNAFFPDLKKTISTNQYAEVYDLIKQGKDVDRIEEAVKKVIEKGGSLSDIKSGISSRYKSDYFDMYQVDPNEAQKLGEKAARGYAAIGMDDEEIEGIIDSWKEESITYPKLYKAIMSGEGIEEQIDKLREAGKADDKIAEKVADKFFDTIVYADENEISSPVKENTDKAIKYITGMDFDSYIEAEEKAAIEAEAEKAAKAKATAEKKAKAEENKAINEVKKQHKTDLFNNVTHATGNMEKLIDDVYNDGTDYSKIKKALTDEFKGKNLTVEQKRRIAQIKAKCDEKSGFKLDSGYSSYEAYEWSIVSKW